MPNQDPRDAGPKPEFPRQEQEGPGREKEMRPAADHGEESYRGLGRLQGRVALITGGDSGIGRAVAIAFAREGADVAFGYLDEHEDARETLRQIEAAGRRGLSRAGDLADPAECERLVDEAFAKLGRVDVLVHNAAFQRQAVERFEEIDPPGLERTFRVNVLAAFHLVRRALPRLKPGASIITVSSIQAYEPSPPILDYASTKGALVTFTKGLAKELAGRGIRVNSVAPGPVWTPLVVQSFDAEKNAKFGENAPLGRPAQPAELAPAFVFLACDESTYVTGEVLGVTGGRTLA
jgi:NAD(P)-dependent dehydrogenase (short-subunit alcohol dehydrogenase family)